MTTRIAELIKELNLKPHPEGGYYAETYRSKENVVTSSGTRNMMTAIYFLLTSNDISRFHVIKSDELWFHHEGSDLSVHVLDENGHRVLRLGNTHASAKPQHLVPAGKIFGSTVDDNNTYALVSCVVAPGFDFQDFRMLSKDELNKRFPDYKDVIRKLGV